MDQDLKDFLKLATFLVACLAAIAWSDADRIIAIVEAYKP